MHESTTEKIMKNFLILVLTIVGICLLCDVFDSVLDLINR